MEARPAELVEFLAPYPAEVQELALAARLRLHELAGPAHDMYFDATQAVCAGLCYTEKQNDSFVNIAVYSDHVTLVFGWGARLMDPEKRLKGEGNRVRHIRLAGIETLSDSYVAALVEQAAKLAVPRQEPFEPRTIVKVYAGPKRRPVR